MNIYRCYGCSVELTSGNKIGLCASCSALTVFATSHGSAHIADLEAQNAELQGRIAYFVGRIQETNRLHGEACQERDVEGIKAERLEAELRDAKQLHGVYQTQRDAVEAQNARLKEQAEKLAGALERAERKLSAYVGVCSGDKELNDTVLPMARRALADYRSGK